MQQFCQQPHIAQQLDSSVNSQYFSALKHSPSKKVRKEMALKKTSTTKTSSNDGNVESSNTSDNAGIGVGNTLCGAASATSFSMASTKPEISFSSSQKGKPASTLIPSPQVP